MTLLSAVNVVLTALNLEETADVASPDSPVVARAKALVENLNATKQVQGWWFNRTGLKTLAPDVNDNINVSSNVIAVQPYDTRNIIALKDGLIYDLLNDTDEWGDNLKVYLTYEIPFEDTPPAWQEYIAREAALQLHQSLRGNTGSSSTVAQERDRAMAMMKAQDFRGRRHSLQFNPFQNKIVHKYRR